MCGAHIAIATIRHGREERPPCFLYIKDRVPA